MALKFYDSPFHATEDAEVASKSVLKIDLTIMIRDIIEQQNWTQAVAADKLGISQPRVSNLVNGKIEKFTLDNLLKECESVYEYYDSFILNTGNENIMEKALFLASQTLTHIILLQATKNNIANN